MPQTCAMGTVRRFAAALLCLCLLCAAVLPAAHAESSAPAGPSIAEADGTAPEVNDGTQEPANGDAQDAADGEIQAIANDAPLPAAKEGIMTIASGTAGDFTVDPAGGWLYDFENNVLILYSSGDYTIYGNRTKTAERIEIYNTNFTGKITLNDVNIETSTGSPFMVSYNYDNHVTVELQGTNTLTALGPYPGLEYTFFDNVYEGSLTITGPGSLIATGGDAAAGIGSRGTQKACSATRS